MRGPGRILDGADEKLLDTHHVVGQGLGPHDLAHNGNPVAECPA
jgi:hypothetical protein